MAVHTGQIHSRAAARAGARSRLDMVTATTNAYEVLAIRYASRQAVKSEVYLNFHLYGEPDDAIGMDYFVWVARNAQRTILVDTGFSVNAGQRRGRPMVVTPVAALAGLGIDPKA